MNVHDIRKDASTKLLEPIAISYLRFSGISQARGDSSRRQETASESFTKVTGIPVVEALADLGLSGYHGRHVKRGDLGKFLEQIKTDSFRKRTERRDIYLVVENLDRLSREKIPTAMKQISDIVESGVKVVTMMDGKVYDEEALNDMASLIISITIMSRAHEESLVKSKRNCEVWEQKRQKMAKGDIISKKCPNWLKLSKDRKSFVEIPEAVAVVRRIFREVIEGKTLCEICRGLNSEGVRTLKVIRGDLNKTKRPLWSPTSASYVLKNPAVIGTKVMKDAKGNIKLEVKDYYPAIISPAIRAQARKVFGPHESQRGRTSTTHSNLFRKLAVDKTTGECFVMINPNAKHCYMVPSSYKFDKGRKGHLWNRASFESIFFHTIRLAFNVEGSLAEEEANLALCEKELSDVQSRIGKLVRVIEESDDDDFIEISQRIAELRKVKKHKLEEQETIRESILAGAGRCQLDPDEEDRGKLMETLRVNVRRIDVDCKDKWFRVELMNGIRYEVQLHKSGEIEVTTNDFEVASHVKLNDLEIKVA